MVFELHTERRAYAEVLEHEVKRLARMLRAFPAERFDERQPECGHSARELAGEFVAHVRRIEEIVYGRVMPKVSPDSRTRAALLLELETVAMGAYAALTTLPASRWSEVLEVPAGLAPWAQARRGELLWLALRELARDDRHFALHLRAARYGGGTAPTARRFEAADLVTLGA